MKEFSEGSLVPGASLLYVSMGRETIRVWQLSDATLLIDHEQVRVVDPEYYWIPGFKNTVEP